MPTIAELLTAYRDRTGASYEDMARKVGDEINRSRMHQLATAPPNGFPRNARTFELLAELLEVPVTTIVLAFAAGLGLPISTQQSRVALLMPANTDKLLSDRDIAALVDIARSMVEARIKVRRITSYDGKRLGFKQPDDDAAATVDDEDVVDPGPITGPEPATREDYGLAARRGDSEGRRARHQQDLDAES